MQFSTYISRLPKSTRYFFNPIQNLTPDSLTRMIEAFHNGYLRSAALTWEAIERRDDTLQGVISKRKKSIARLKWEILTTEDSEEASAQKEALEFFYNHIQAINAFDENETGGLQLLIKQMMDSVAKKYAVHEIIFQPTQTNTFKKDSRKEKIHNFLTASFRFVPLWFFENRSGKLRFLPEPFDYSNSTLIQPGSWMITTGDGLMESSSIAYLFKHLPLRDWLIYCERNGMPGVKGVTDALPNSPEWESAKNAVQNFGAEFHALMSSGTSIEAIDLSSKGELPYPALVERMDRAMTALWRGSDLSTMSKTDAAGISLQMQEMALVEEDDANLISDTLNSQVDKYVIKYLFDSDSPKAYFKLKPSQKKNLNEDLNVFYKLWEMGVPLALTDIREHFGLATPHEDETILEKDQNDL